MTYASTNTDTITLVANPIAGRGMAAKTAQAAQAYLNAHGAKSELVYTTRKGDARILAQAAINRGSRIVVAVGGDGTLHEVANALLDASTSDATLGLIPAGTGNDVARGIGLYGSLDLACKALLMGRRSHIDVGRIIGGGLGEGQYFLGAAGLGFVADTALTVNKGVRFLTGKAAYLFGALVTIARLKPFDVGVRVDGRDLTVASGTLVSVSNVQTTGGGLTIAPGAKVDDGLLDICFVGPVGRAEFLKQLPRVISGSHTDHPAVIMMKGQRIEIETSRPKDLWIDGEIAGTTPAVFQVERTKLPVMLPATSSLSENNR